jgi:hypothetical protein
MERQPGAADLVLGDRAIGVTRCVALNAPQELGRNGTVVRNWGRNSCERWCGVRRGLQRGRLGDGHGVLDGGDGGHKIVRQGVAARRWG